jgi:hypothetical protein
MDTNAECSVSKTLQQIQKALAQKKDLLAKMQFMGCKIETVQDVLCKLGMKPQTHATERSIFSLNNVIIRLTKIMNRADKNWAHF